jgi:hypothetical protein
VRGDVAVHEPQRCAVEVDELVDVVQPLKRRREDAQLHRQRDELDQAHIDRRGEPQLRGQAKPGASIVVTPAE